MWGSDAAFEWDGGNLTGSYGILNGASLVITNSADKYFSTAFITNNGTILCYGTGLLMGMLLRLGRPLSPPGS